MGQQQKQRTFEDKPATRERVPLMIGLMGPSGGGKTFSALRLATGIQRVTGGEIFVVDTEARRALHYADRFKFRHLQFGAPFGPLDYLDAIDHCVAKNAGVIIVDSMSHEHEGPGGVLEIHEQEVQRLSRGDAAKAERVKMLAWSKPKQERRRMINSILQKPCNFIFCFRAKEKVKVERGKDPESMGFMPIAGEEFVYEMTVNALLLPNAGGVPTWKSEQMGERMMIKLPEQFRQRLFGNRQPLSEDTGEHLARWAAGDSVGGGSESEPPPAPSPAFRRDIGWEHRDAMSGRMLSEASFDTLMEYGTAIQKAIDNPRAKEKPGLVEQFKMHLADVEAEMELKQAGGNAAAEY